MNTPSQLSIIPRLATPHKHTCYFCFHRSTHIHLEDALNWRGRDVMRYGCDDVKACLERIEKAEQFSPTQECLAESPLGKGENNGES